MGATPLTQQLSQQLWRLFPWDSAAAEGQPFSPSYVPPKQGSGRFDLGGRPLVLYLAESPSHAVAEKIQRYRGQVLDWPELSEFGRPLSLVQATLTLADPDLLADLCDPAQLSRYGCRPDELMSRDLTRTQGVSRRLYDQGLAGFRWWSALSGDWHSTVLYLDRVTASGKLEYGAPTPLDLDSPALTDAAAALSIAVG
jgi:hypothetical protein